MPDRTQDGKDCCGNRGEEYIAQLRAVSRADYVLGSFNVDSLDVLGRLTARAAQQRSAIIFQFGPWNAGPLSIEQIGGAAKALLASWPAAFLHLDHGAEEGFIRRSLDAGFDSVMFDGSGLELAENIARTRAIVKAGHARGAAVEGAVGVLEKGVDTDVEIARRFVADTGVDALAVAIGTGHGQPREVGDIDVDRLRELSALGTPLVLHGGSGLPKEVMGEIRRTAVAKINVGTALFRNCAARLAHCVDSDEKPLHPSDLGDLAADAFWEIMLSRMEGFGCLGKETAQ